MENEKANKALDYLLHHIEDFGEAKYTRTGELNCVGHLAYNCVDMVVAMNVIKIMEGEDVENVKSSYKQRVSDIKYDTTEHSFDHDSVCPECGSTNLFDFETKMECEDCGFVWNK